MAKNSASICLIGAFGSLATAAQERHDAVRTRRPRHTALTVTCVPVGHLRQAARDRECAVLVVAVVDHVVRDHEGRIRSTMKTIRPPLRSSIPGR